MYLQRDVSSRTRLNQSQEEEEEEEETRGCREKTKRKKNRVSPLSSAGVLH